MVKGFKVAVATAVIAVSGFAGTAIVTAVPAHAGIAMSECSPERMKVRQEKVEQTLREIRTLERRLERTKVRKQKQARMREIARLENRLKVDVKLLADCQRAAANAKLDERGTRRFQ